jgi:4-hydroxybenzoate polyprenyltransferase
MGDRGKARLAPILSVATGRRGIVKTAHLWLPLGTVLLAGHSRWPPDLWLNCFLIFGAVACWTQCVILANDVADSAQDVEAGKARWIARRSRPAAIGWVLLLAAVGLLCALQAPRPLGPVIVYCAANLTGLAYSLGPLRLKERGILGLPTYAGSAMLAFAVLPWVWFGADAVTFWVLAPAVLLDKWTNLHFHQVVDYEDDSASEAQTYAVRVGLPRAVRTLRVAAFLACVWLVAALAFLCARLPGYWGLVGGAGAGAAVAVAAYARIRQSASNQENALTKGLPPIYLGLTQAAFRAVPVLLFAGLAATKPGTWPILALMLPLLLLEAWQLLHYTHR